MHYRLILACAVTIPAVLTAQPKSAIEFYDTTGANATARFGWRGSQADGEFYVQTPVGSDAVTVKQGDMAVAGDVNATGTVTASGFAGDGNALTNLPEPQGLQGKLDAKADTSHTHQLSDVTGLQQKLTGKADTSHTHALSEIAPGGISGSDIATGAIGNNHLRDSAVTSSKIRDGSITDADISAAALIAGRKIVPEFGSTGRIKLLPELAPNLSGIQMQCKNHMGQLEDYYSIQVANYENVGAEHNKKTHLLINTAEEVIASFYSAQATSPDFPAFHVARAAYIGGGVQAENGVCCSSDKRLKTNIQPIEGAMDKVAAMRGVTFEWDRASHPEREFAEGSQVGLIAQEVESVLPQLVETSHTGYKMVHYDKVVAVLVEGLKEQQQTIEELQRQVAELKAHIQR